MLFGRELSRADLSAFVLAFRFVHIAAKNAIPEDEQPALVAVGLALDLRVVRAVHVRCDQKQTRRALREISTIYLCGAFPRPRTTGNGRLSLDEQVVRGSKAIP